MPSGPYDPQDDATLISSSGVGESRSFIAHYQAADPAAASTTAVHAAVTDTGVQQVVTTGITDPDYPRAISATSGGTAGDIKAVQVIIAGTDISGAAITETLPVFTVNSATTVHGSKAFATVTSITIPAHDGLGATTSIGYNDKLGICHKLTRNTLINGKTFLAGAAEGTDPSVTVSATVLSSNTVDLNSALDGTQVDFYYLVDGDE